MPGPDDHVPDDLGLLRDAALRAGDIARDYLARGLRVQDKPGGQGPVTDADLAIDAMLRDTLTAARPDYGWLSEETADTPERLSRSRVFIVDPIDGTRAFIDGQQGFSHVLSVIEDGVPIAAVVHLPLPGLTYAATRGGSVTLNGAPVQVSPRQEVEGAQVLAAKPQLHPDLWPGGVPQVERHFRPSLAWRLALVAEGRFDAMLTLRPTWHWDIAAGSLLVTEAGGLVSDAHGQTLRFNTLRPLADGIIAAGPGLHDGLVARRRRTTQPPRLG
ncbi:MAG: 3'(2'),5'-bisphosphate nucleotidase CysQ [Roseinatronobacter sp.]